MLYKEISQLAIDASHEVYTSLGTGHSRPVYLKAVQLELEALDVNFATSEKYSINYRDKVIGDVEIELLIEEKVLVYVSAEAQIPNHTYSQVRSLMQTSDIPLGMIIGFGGNRLDVRRVEIPDKQRKRPSPTNNDP